MKFWKAEIDNAEHAVLTLDLGPEEKQNKLRVGAIEELDEFLKSNILNSLVICSAKPDSFCAGADIEEIREAFRHPEEVNALFARIDSIADRLLNAPFPSVAAISGATLGGGLELAMMCTERIAVDTPKTVFGLPETSLGIIPGFGGTQTLPRIVGLRKAAEIILGGAFKKLSAKDALKCGLISKIVNFPSTLLESARERVRHLGSSGYRNGARHTPGIEKIPFFGRRMILKGAKTQTLRLTKGVYPAPLKAIEAMRKSACSFSTGLANEHRLFKECLRTDEAKSLISLYFLREEARSKKWVDAPPQAPPKRLGVIGAGNKGQGMGKGIAYAAISAGIPTLLHDVSPDNLHDAVVLIGKSLMAEVKKGKLTADQANARLGLLSWSYGTRYESFPGCDFVIEAITENLQWKHDLLGTLGLMLPESTVVVTNTSSLLPSEVGKSFPWKESFAAMHFFNPAEKMELVEIAGTPDTKPETIARALTLTRMLGKTPVVLDKECAGLVVNRILLRGVGRAFTETFRHGVNPWLIDEALEHTGCAMGPFKTSDQVGFDTAAHVLKIMSECYPANYPETIKDLNLAGNKNVLGKKTGRGFYFWKDDKVLKPNADIFSDLQIPFDRQNIEATAAFAATEVMVEMRREALDLISEGVLKSGDMIDLAMILGAGICPNHRGILGLREKVELPKLSESEELDLRKLSP